MCCTFYLPFQQHTVLYGNIFPQWNLSSLLKILSVSDRFDYVFLITNFPNIFRYDEHCTRASFLTCSCALHNCTYVMCPIMFAELNILTFTHFYHFARSARSAISVTFVETVKNSNERINEKEADLHAIVIKNK